MTPFVCLSFIFQAIESVTSVLGVSDEEASILLRHFKWNAVRVHEEWFQARWRLCVSVVAPPDTDPAATCATFCLAVYTKRTHRPRT